MTAYSKFKSALLLVAITVLIAPVEIEADQYKWLKTREYGKIFIYTDFEDCDFIAKELFQTIRVVLLRSKIKPTISNSLVFQSTGEDKISIRELLNEDLIDKQKIFIHIYGKCIEYDSVYIYQFSIHFAKFDNKYSNALLYSSPEHNVMGADKFYGIKRAFKKIMEDAVTDYLSANMNNPSR